MSIRPSSNLHTSLVEENSHKNIRCDQCGGRIGDVVGYRACVQCNVTPNGNYIDTEEEVETNTNQLPTSVSAAKHQSTYYKNPYDNEASYDEYNSYSLMAGRCRRKMVGGYESAYKDVDNGLEYCIAEKALQNEHYDGPIIWD